MLSFCICGTTVVSKRTFKVSKTLQRLKRVIKTVHWYRFLNVSLTNLEMIRTGLLVYKHWFHSDTTQSHSVVLSPFAKNFHIVKMSVLVLYANEEIDVMSETCSSVVMAEAVAIFFKMLIRRIVERKELLVPMLVFPATPSPRAGEVCAVISICICCFKQGQLLSAVLCLRIWFGQNLFKVCNSFS